MLIRALADEGVEFLFGYPGVQYCTFTTPFFSKTKSSTFWCVMSKRLVMRLTVMRATGKVGCVLVTSGPGATNTVTPIATAYMDSIPMVVISGQVPSNLIGEDAFQETDMVGVSRPIVKHSFQVRHASEIPAIVKKRFISQLADVQAPLSLTCLKTALTRTKNSRMSTRRKLSCAHTHHRYVVMLVKLRRQ